MLNDSESNPWPITESLKKGRIIFENDNFIRLHRESIDKNIPLAEEFVVSFIAQFFKPFTEEETNPIFSQLDITEDDEKEIVRIINDAFKLAKVEKLTQSIDVSDISGYTATEGTRAFRSNTMFLNFRGIVGSNPVLDLVDNLNSLRESYLIAQTAHKLEDPRAELSYLITKDGKIFKKEPYDDLGDIMQLEEMQTTEPELKHTEGDGENNNDYTFSLMIAWDIDSSLPIFISLGGSQGLLGQVVRLKFSFESSTGVNPFPLPPIETESQDIEYSVDGNQIDCIFTSKPQSNGKRYREAMKLKQIGLMQAYDGSELKVWANNGKWNSLSSIESDNN